MRVTAFEVRFLLVSANITFESVVSAEEESDKDLIEVDAAMPLPSPPCFLSPSVLLTPLLEGVGVLLRDCAWLCGEGFFSFLKGSSMVVGPPGSFGGPLEDDVQLESLGCGRELTPFLEMGRPKPPSMDWILRSCAGSSFWKEEYFKLTLKMSLKSNSKAGCDRGLIPSWPAARREARSGWPSLSAQRTHCSSQDATSPAWWSARLHSSWFQGSLI